MNNSDPSGNCTSATLAVYNSSPTPYNAPIGNNPMEAMWALDGYLNLPYWQIAGIVGNLMEESIGVNPIQGQVGGGGGIGIAQWGAIRWNQFKSWLTSGSGINYGIWGPIANQWNLNAQLGFVAYELQTTYSPALVALENSQSVADATTQIMDYYEHPALGPSDHINRRIQDAEWVYWEFGQTYPTAGSGVYSGPTFS